MRMMDTPGTCGRYFVIGFAAVVVFLFPPVSVQDRWTSRPPRWMCEILPESLTTRTLDITYAESAFSEHGNNLSHSFTTNKTDATSSNSSRVADHNTILIQTQSNTRPHGEIIFLSCRECIQHGKGWMEFGTGTRCSRPVALKRESSTYICSVFLFVSVLTLNTQVFNFRPWFRQNATRAQCPPIALSPLSRRRYGSWDRIDGM